MKNLRDKKVLVNGGAQGIGYAVAECFAKEGADVLLVISKSKMQRKQQKRCMRSTVLTPELICWM